MSNKTRKKQIENQAQQGRSMVEMLGVLAIIGVISIGGISGYRMAMNRYQANQIANEINLMRTDAKMKVARGVELLLGEPYDGEDGHLNFGSNYGVKVESKDIVDGEITERGYSFTLSNIPEGVCKPLVTLLDNMDDTADITIDGKSYYDENASEDFCGETNEVMVAFSTKDLGGVSSGSGEEPGQGDQPQDEPVCDATTCPGGECNEEDGTCQCPGDKNWTGTDCIMCPTGTTWNDTERDCMCTGANEYWDGNQCVTCDESTGGTWDEENKECKCDDEGKYWSDSAGACIENPCNKDGQGCAADEFCLSTSCNGCSGDTITESVCSYSCKNISDYKADNQDSEHPDRYVMSKSNMNWWSAERFCKAQKKRMVTITDLECNHSIKASGGDGTWCYCHAKDSTQTCTGGSNTDLSDKIKAIRRAKAGGDGSSGSGSLWLYDSYTRTTAGRNSCRAYNVGLTDGDVTNSTRDYDRYALCE